MNSLELFGVSLICLWIVTFSLMIQGHCLKCRVKKLEGNATASNATSNVEAGGLFGLSYGGQFDRSSGFSSLLLAHDIVSIKMTGCYQGRIQNYHPVILIDVLDEPDEGLLLHVMTYASDNEMKLTSFIGGYMLYNDQKKRARDFYINTGRGKIEIKSLTQNWRRRAAVQIISKQYTHYRRQKAYKILAPYTLHWAFRNNGPCYRIVSKRFVSITCDMMLLILKGG